MKTLRHTLIDILEELEALEVTLEPASNRARITRRCDYISELVDEVTHASRAQHSLPRSNSAKSVRVGVGEYEQRTI